MPRKILQVHENQGVISSVHLNHISVSVHVYGRLIDNSKWDQPLCQLMRDNVVSPHLVLSVHIHDFFLFFLTSTHFYTDF